MLEAMIENELIKKSEAIKAISELDISMSMCLTVEDCLATRFGRDLALDAVKRIDPVSLLDTQVYGYKLNDILVFADACRLGGVSNRELKDFVNETQRMFGIFAKKFDEQLADQIKRYFCPNFSDLKETKA